MWPTLVLYHRFGMGWRLVWPMSINVGSRWLLWHTNRTTQCSFRETEITLRNTYQRMATFIKNDNVTTHSRSAKCWQRLRLKHRPCNKTPSYFSTPTILYDRFISCSAHQPQVVIHAWCLSRRTEAPAQYFTNSRWFSLLHARPVKNVTQIMEDASQSDNRVIS